ncbi:hypothetical protein [Prosthecobacter vanneervenii]|uniref:Uncharacterized protein n=1 Tax=Prosthecobacter vanneervenii TaxID=48466 RepID=A0A7W7YFY4_9BACT|nr:hypothetical protein [Prosthecobacter vanneervenii]MBB5035461.1 hypothetical protein [Prosthecobacter vanneervenii]
MPTPEEVGGAQKAIDKLKAQDRPLSQEEQRQLDAAEKTVARKTEANLLAQKAAVEKAGKSLHPTAAKALADAQAVLARPAFANSDSLPGSHEAGNILQSSSTKPPALPDIPFPEKSPQAKVEREKRSQARSQVLEQHGIKPEDKARILSMENGKRPDPKTYMSEAFIKAHREEFIDGASRIISTNSLKKYGPSQIDKTAFVFPTSKLSDLLKEAGGDRGKLEDLLGIPRGQLGSRPLSRVDFKDPASLNIRIPSGNEAGANDQWLPGARLPTGTLEGVIDVENTTSPSWTHEDLSIK